MEYIGQKGELWEQLHAQADGTAPLPHKDNQEAERLVAIASAVITGEDHLELAVNVPNHGKIPNLPPTAVVEVPAVVGAAGIIGLGVGPLPDGIAAILTARALQQEITVRAALDGDRELAIQALALDPLVPGPTVAEAILDDAVKAHGAVLDRFAAPKVTS
jgi:alpha-galactosidase